MTASGTPDVRKAADLGRYLVVLAVAAAVAIFLLRDVLPWLTTYPDGAVIPFKDWIGAVMNWMKVNLTWFTRSLAAIMDVPLRFAFNLLAKGFKLGSGPEATVLPRLSWAGVVGVMGWLGYLYGGWRLALLCGGGVFLLAWLASGWLSYSPFGWLPGSFVSAGERQWLVGGRIDGPTLAAFNLPAVDFRAGKTLREVEWSRFSGTPLLHVRSLGPAGVHTRLVTAAPSPGEIALTRNGRLTVEAIAARAAGLLPSARLVGAEEVGSYDAEYLPHRHRQRSLPVVRLRFDDAERTVYYVDPATGRIETRIDDPGRSRRWGFAALHRLDFPPFGQNFALRATLASAALLVAMALCAAGCVLGWRRLGRFSRQPPSPG